MQRGSFEKNCGFIAENLGRFPSILDDLLQEKRGKLEQLMQFINEYVENDSYYMEATKEDPSEGGHPQCKAHFALIKAGQSLLQESL